jgi:hypothetical protein
MRSKRLLGGLPEAILSPSKDALFGSENASIPVEGELQPMPPLGNVARDNSMQNSPADADTGSISSILFSAPPSEATSPLRSSQSYDHSAMQKTPKRGRFHVKKRIEASPRQAHNTQQVPTTLEHYSTRSEVWPSTILMDSIANDYSQEKQQTSTELDDLGARALVRKVMKLASFYKSIQTAISKEKIFLSQVTKNKCDERGSNEQNLSAAVDEAVQSRSKTTDKGFMAGLPNVLEVPPRSWATIAKHEGSTSPKDDLMAGSHNVLEVAARSLEEVNIAKHGFLVRAWLGILYLT